MARRGSAGGPDGLVIIDKEAGWTSHDVVAKLRGILRQRRTGHAGTLDPSATGVLLVGVGKVTRLLRFLQDTTKRYEGDLVFGAQTTTLDADGEVTATFAMDGITLATAQAATKEFTGHILQTPPMVSALKVDGKRLHQLAREGIEVERTPRPVRVDEFSLHETDDPLRFRFTVTCSSGTYVRSLVDDLGRALGGGAYMASLRRTGVGAFTLAEAHLLGELADRAAKGEQAPDFSGLLLTPAEALRGMASVVVDEAAVARVANGLWLEGELSPISLGSVAILGPSGDLLAVYEKGASGRLEASVVLHAAGTA